MDNNIKPRERILKKVRNALLARQEAVTMSSKWTVPEKVSATKLLEQFINSLEQRGVKVVVCTNQYHFLDEFLGHIESIDFHEVVCDQPVIQTYLDSCGQPYVDRVTISTKQAAVVSQSQGAVAENGLIASTSQLPIAPHQVARMQILAKNQLLQATQELLQRIKEAFQQKTMNSSFIEGPANLDETVESRDALFILETV